MILALVAVVKNIKNVAEQINNTIYSKVSYSNKK